jgi:hypothetical protein
VHQSEEEGEKRPRVLDATDLQHVFAGLPGFFSKKRIL